jgi:hypothetical protein
MNTGIVSIIGLLLVLFLVIMIARDGVVGYSSAKTLTAYPYEGFESAQNAFEKRYAEALTPASPVPGPVPTVGTVGTAGAEKKEGFEPMVKEVGVSKVLSGVTAYGSENIIGFMYNNEGSASCKAYGYTNSKGNVCLSDSDIKLLTTRGGNATGPSDQIGASAK